MARRRYMHGKRRKRSSLLDKKYDLKLTKPPKVKPVVNIRATSTKKGNEGGGYVGIDKTTKWGGFNIGVGGGGTSKEGYKVKPSFGLSFNL